MTAAPAEVVHCYIPACEKCGGDVAVYPDPPEPAYCEEHCPGHEYEHDPWRRGHYCVICDAQRPYEPFDP